MALFSDLTLVWLFLSGILIGIFAIVFGGAMFLSIPVFQLLFPQLGMGAIIANIKIGSVIRNISAVAILRRHIRLKDLYFLIFLFCAGALAGAFAITNVSQWLILPAILFAILVTEFASFISKHIPKHLYYLAVFGVGVFGGIIGAGIVLLIIALLRIRIHEDERIHEVRAIALFIDLLIALSAVVVFLFGQQLILKIWLTWSLGSVIGGYLGGKIVHYTGKLSAKTQKNVLRATFVFAIVVAVMKLF